MENQLSLSEKLLLLAIRPQKGGIAPFSFSIDLVIAGASILEMELTGNVRIAEGRAESTGLQTNHPLHLYMLSGMIRANKPRKIERWLTSRRLSMRKVKGDVFQSLVRKKEIRLEERRFLFFRWKRPYLHPGNHSGQVIDQAKRLINQPSGNEEDLYFLMLLDPAGLLRRIYPERGMRKAALRKIRQLRENNLNAGAVAKALAVVKAIQRVQAARRAAT